MTLRETTAKSGSLEGDKSDTPEKDGLTRTTLAAAHLKYHSNESKEETSDAKVKSVLGE